MYKSKKDNAEKFIGINENIANNNPAFDNYLEKQDNNNNRTITDKDYCIAFEKEALPHIRILNSFAYKMVGNNQDAEDIVQETYLRAFRFFNTYEKGTNCKAWLFKIMKNVMINKYRKEEKEAEKVSFDDVMNYVVNIKSIHFEIDDYQQKLFSRLLDDEMAVALNTIHDVYKSVVILYDLEDLSYEEIAEFLNCPIGTVRSRLHRGRRMLQQKLFLYAKQRGYSVTSVH